MYRKSVIHIKSTLKVMALFAFTLLVFSCKKDSNLTTPKDKEVTAKDILGNPNYPAISFGGYRDISRDIQPTIPELKEDMKI